MEKHNNGYGTFDMKSYDADTVYHILYQTDSQGFVIYQRYFIGDYLFIIALAILQILMVLYAFRWTKTKIIPGILIAVSIIRGLFDMTENTILFYILRTYPQRHDFMINFSDEITFLKLKLFPVWIVIFITGFILKLTILKRQKS